MVESRAIIAFNVPKHTGTQYGFHYSDEFSPADYIIKENVR